MSEPDQGSPEQATPKLVSAHIGALYDRKELLKTSLEGQILAHARFVDLDLKRVDFRGANLMGATFIGCDLRDAIFHYAQLESAQFIDCLLDGGDFWSAEVSNLRVGRRSDLLTRRGLSSPREFQVRYIVSHGFLYEVFQWEPTQIARSSSSASRPLVLLHGMTGHALDFEQIAIHVDRTVYAIQLIGHGVTSYVSLAAEAELVDIDEDSEGGIELEVERVAPSYTETLEQVLEVIMSLLVDEAVPDRHEKPDPVSFDLLGYSMGGRLALHISRALSRSVTGSHPLARYLNVHQTLVIGASLGLRDADERDARRQRDRQWSDYLWMSKHVDDFLRAWNQQPLLARLHDVNRKEAERIAVHRKSHDPKGLAIAFDSLGLGEMPPLHDELMLITHPIYWIYGAEDEKYQLIAHQASALHTSSVPVPIYGTGHSPHLENFDKFWGQVEPLLRGSETR